LCLSALASWHKEKCTCRPVAPYVFSELTPGTAEKTNAEQVLVISCLHQSRRTYTSLLNFPVVFPTLSTSFNKKYSRISMYLMSISCRRTTASGCLEWGFGLHRFVAPAVMLAISDFPDIAKKSRLRYRCGLRPWHVAESSPVFSLSLSDSPACFVVTDQACGDRSSSSSDVRRSYRRVLNPMTESSSPMRESYLVMQRPPEPMPTQNFQRAWHTRRWLLRCSSTLWYRRGTQVSFQKVRKPQAALFLSVLTPLLRLLYTRRIFISVHAQGTWLSIVSP
jgi:hypothetical protein